MFDLGSLAAAFDAADLGVCTVTPVSLAFNRGARLWRRVEAFDVVPWTPRLARRGRGMRRDGPSERRRCPEASGRARWTVAAPKFARGIARLEAASRARQPLERPRTDDACAPRSRSAATPYSCANAPLRRVTLLRVTGFQDMLTLREVASD